MISINFGEIALTFNFLYKSIKSYSSFETLNCRLRAGFETSWVYSSRSISRILRFEEASLEHENTLQPREQIRALRLPGLSFGAQPGFFPPLSNYPSNDAATLTAPFSTFDPARRDVYRAESH